MTCTCRNKVRLTLDEAYELAEVKANIEWTPVVPDVVKAAPLSAVPGALPAIHVHLPDHLTTELTIPTPQFTVNVPDFPDIPAPVVNLPAPIVNLPETVVNVPAPIVNVAAAKATTPQEVIVTSLPDRIHKAIRNADGTIQGSIEGDYDGG